MRRGHRKEGAGGQEEQRGPDSSKAGEAVSRTDTERDRDGT